MLHTAEDYVQTKRFSATSVEGHQDKNNLLGVLNTLISKSYSRSVESVAKEDENGVILSRNVKIAPVLTVFTNPNPINCLFIPTS